MVQGVHALLIECLVLFWLGVEGTQHIALYKGESQIIQINLKIQTELKMENKMVPDERP